MKFFKLLLILFLMALAFFAIVMPNSFQLSTAILLVVFFAFALLSRRLFRMQARFTLMFLAGILITLLYVFYGELNGAPDRAQWQTLAIYIFFPALWIFAGMLAISTLGNEGLARAIALFSLPACASIAIFFYLYLTFGPDSVTLFVEEANVNLRGTTVAARMHVYAPLIFLCGGIFAAPSIISQAHLRIIAVLSLTFAILTSGRSALFVSPFIGVTILAIASWAGGMSSRLIFAAIVSLLAGTLSLIYLASYFNVSIDDSIKIYFEDLVALGGSVRMSQTEALLLSFLEGGGLGVGHGVSADLIRDVENPWRYEMMIHATLHRVGLVGFIVYVLPFAIYIFEAFRELFRDRLPVYRRFWLGGGLAALVSTATNPYIESFVLQWMFVFPLLDWYMRRHPMRGPNIQTRRGIRPISALKPTHT